MKTLLKLAHPKNSVESTRDSFIDSKRDMALMYKSLEDKDKYNRADRALHAKSYEEFYKKKGRNYVRRSAIVPGAAGAVIGGLLAGKGRRGKGAAIGGTLMAGLGMYGGKKDVESFDRTRQEIGDLDKAINDSPYHKMRAKRMGMKT